MSTPFIYIVGKSDPQAATAAAIRKAGYQVGLFYDQSRPLKNRQRYDNVVPIDFSQLENSLTAELRALPIKGLVCTYENYVIAKAKLAHYLGVPSLSVESAAACTDKYLMRQAFLDYDPTITPAFEIIESAGDATAFAQKYGFPLIIKPTNLVKSLLVLRCDNLEELQTNVAYARQHLHELYKQNHIYDREPALLIEQFITGKQCSVAVFTDASGKPYVCEGIVDLMSAQEVGHDDNFLYSRTLPASLSRELEQKIYQTAESAVRALRLTSSPAHVELMYDEETGAVQVIEVGARIGGYRPRMYQLSYGIDLTAQEVALAVGDKPQLTGTFRAYSAVFELFPKTQGTFLSLTGGDISSPDFTYSSMKAKPGDLVGPAKAGFRATAVVIVSHDNLAAFRKLCDQVRRLQVEVTL